MHAYSWKGILSLMNGDIVVVADFHVEFFSQFACYFIDTKSIFLLFSIICLYLIGENALLFDFVSV